MKAFRNIGGNVVEVEIDVDLNGNPILPPDTTVDPRPEPQPGHYVTVVGNSWVQIPIPQEVISFEYKKQKRLEALSTYKNWYLDQPVTYNNIKFDADEKARIRLTQALVVYNETGYLPQAWVTADNTLFPLNSIDDLKGIINAVQTAFSTRFFEMEAIRQQIINADDDASLDAINIPTIPPQM